ncbi:MAG: sulfurtransferase complex subunit TusB [Gammaproteobacteria bacterium]|nr:sulfurtransferase complex subunit TusB [Gammaproteobacteria bacterium]
MAMLHTVNKSPFERNSLESCLRLAKSGSSVLLTEDGVVGAMQGTKYSKNVADAMTNVSFYVLGPDLKARGLSESNIVDGVKVVDYSGFVDLAAEHESVQAWL